MTNLNFHRTADCVGRTCLFAVVWLVSALAVQAADTHYVSMPGGYGTNDTAGGYTNWEGAATQIQWAVTAAVDGDTVLVTNGTYNLTNQIVVTNAITLQSVNGRDFTFINGNYPAYSNRCMLLSDTNTGIAIVDGFTISNGYITTSSGGGVYIFGGSLKNCHIHDNYGAYGGGVAMATVPWGRPFYYAKQDVLNCIINSNRGGNFGGALIGGGQYGGNCGMVSNCVISYNTATTAGYPGGLELGEKSMYNSEISYNTGPIGGIKAGWNASMIYECKIIGNSGTDCGGVSFSKGHTWGLRNCLVYSNHATTGAGGVKIWMECRYVISDIIRNSTIVSNSTDSSTNAGGIYFYSLANSNESASIYNSIVYYNSAGGPYSNVCNGLGSTNINVYNCCIGTTNDAFLPATNVNNIIYADPLLIDLPVGNCRLSSSSPCINAGMFETWMTTGVDLDNRIRIRYGIVDLGAYEFVRSGTIYGFH
ncbi:MAG: hypothetical protein KJ964_06385 [Verrucomicrobia bacterium]|nr:hypothetical protein [Verrucomicrobiota bacterium]